MVGTRHRKIGKVDIKLPIHPGKSSSHRVIYGSNENGKIHLLDTCTGIGDGVGRRIGSRKEAIKRAILNNGKSGVKNAVGILPCREQHLPINGGAQSKHHVFAAEGVETSVATEKSSSGGTGCGELAMRETVRSGDRGPSFIVGEKTRGAVGVTEGEGYISGRRIHRAQNLEENGTAVPAGVAERHNRQVVGSGSVLGKSKYSGTTQGARDSTDKSAGTNVVSTKVPSILYTLGLNAKE
ncbi:hypothetical protein C8F04DRAFT_1100260 [Mycena alexandri]|uniref:Uncharacterized protein n=1 Tax=Mycena alexandri TaxID=1745969 RepID=A0AAD6SZY9_9AGAR|nr:hypothetical protein C8F04DRAFT_1100260 [Mycena alexandri]